MCPSLSDQEDNSFRLRQLVPEDSPRGILKHRTLEKSLSSSFSSECSGNNSTKSVGFGSQIIYQHPMIIDVSDDDARRDLLLTIDWEAAQVDESTIPEDTREGVTSPPSRIEKSKRMKILLDSGYTMSELACWTPAKKAKYFSTCRRSPSKALYRKVKAIAKKLVRH